MRLHLMPWNRTRDQVVTGTGLGFAGPDAGADPSPR